MSVFPFSTVSYDTDDVSYTTPELLQTLSAVNVNAAATVTATEEISTPTGQVTPVPTAGGSKLVAGGATLMALFVSILII